MEDLGQHLYDENLDNPDEKREALARDVLLVAGHCPRLRKMEVYLYGDVPYLKVRNRIIRFVMFCHFFCFVFFFFRKPTSRSGVRSLRN